MLFFDLIFGNFFTFKTKESIYNLYKLIYKAQHYMESWEIITDKPVCEKSAHCNFDVINKYKVDFFISVLRTNSRLAPFLLSS